MAEAAQGKSDAPEAQPEQTTGREPELEVPTQKDQPPQHETPPKEGDAPRPETTFTQPQGEETAQEKPPPGQAPQASEQPEGETGQEQTPTGQAPQASEQPGEQTGQQKSPPGQAPQNFAQSGGQIAQETAPPGQPPQTSDRPWEQTGQEQQALGQRTGEQRPEQTEAKAGGDEKAAENPEEGTGGEEAPGDGERVLFHHPFTRSTRVVFLLEQLGLPYKRVYVDKNLKPIGPPGSFPDLKLRALPTLLDNDVIITESIAIMEYLLEQYDPEHTLSPPHADKAARAQFLQWLVWAEASLTIPVVGYVVNIVLLPEEKRNQKLADAFKRTALEELGVLEAALAGKTRGVVGDSFSAADISLHYPIFLAAEHAQLVTPEWYPNISTWYTEIKKLPARGKAFASM